MAEAVLGFFYGFDIKLAQKELPDFLDVVDFLEAEPLRQKIQEEILQSLEDYDIFQILNMAFKFGLNRVFD